MRVYVPASRPLLSAWVTAGTVPRQVDERYVAADEDEESEYAALLAAAAASRAGGAERRVVVVAELPDADPDAAFGLDRVVAVHADDRPGAAAEDDLAWYAPDEVPALLA